MQFDEKFLEEMGLAEMAEGEAFLKYLEEELEVRIGERIAEGLSEEQLSEFDAIVDPGEAGAWLEANRPDYREIVGRAVEEMKAEVAANRERLLGRG